MFEPAEIEHKISKQDFDAEIPTLRHTLVQVQRRLKLADFPVLLIVSGVEGSGKGETVNLLNEWMDARYVKTNAFGPATDEERQRPPYWRFSMALPPRGRIGIFFGSWYTEPIASAATGKASPAELDRALARIGSFEEALVHDGALIIKLWFHLSKKQQRRRFEKRQKKAETRWQVTKRDWELAKAYDDYLPIWERTLRKTSTGMVPWTVISGANHRYRNLTTARYVARRIAEHLDQRAVPQPDSNHPPRSADATSSPSPSTTAPPSSASAAAPAPVRSTPLIAKPDTILRELDLSLAIEREEYEETLNHCQGRLNRLSRLAQKQRVSTIAVFEGWDAAGKGGCIRRMTKALDARQYQVIPIAAPTDEERAHHYLWRFWRHLPRQGALTIYDRSWYGRVLVERVEGFAKIPAWMRAYHEICDFEEMLVEHGIVLCKFWLHISPDEQLRRFKEREQIPWKRHKITPEDYRNRDQWDGYEIAVDDMIERTSTEFAPWTLVEAENKRYARIKVLKTLCERLEHVLR